MNSIKLRRLWLSNNVCEIIEINFISYKPILAGKNREIFVYMYIPTIT